MSINKRIQLEIRIAENGCIVDIVTSDPGYTRKEFVATNTTDALQTALNLLKEHPSLRTKEYQASKLILTGVQS